MRGKKEEAERLNLKKRKNVFNTEESDRGLIACAAVPILGRRAARVEEGAV